MSIPDFTPSGHPILFKNEAEPRPVSPTVHPDVIEDDGSAIAARAIAALDDTRRTLTRFEEFRAATLNSSDLTADAKLLEVHTAEEKATERAVTTLAAAGDAANATVRSLESQLEQAARAARKHGGRHDGEIRAHVKSLPEVQRVSFVTGRATAGDVEAVEALLNAPRYLSGLPDTLDDSQATTLRELAAAKAAPHLAEQLAAARKTAKRVEAAWTVAMSLRPAPNQRVEEIKARQRKRAALR